MPLEWQVFQHLKTVHRDWWTTYEPDEIEGIINAVIAAVIVKQGGRELHPVTSEDQVVKRLNDSLRLIEDRVTESADRLTELKRLMWGFGILTEMRPTK